MDAIALERQFSAPNYHPLPVVLTRGEGAYLWDTDGRRYVDMMSAYSAVSHGHGHPRILAALEAQARRLAVPSRAYHNDRLGPFLEKLCAVTGLDAALPMNTGAEAVETAIKAARRWGYRVKGIARDRAEIIVAEGNFHGRTTTIVGFSSEALYRDGFGPFTPGFRRRAVRRSRGDGARDHAEYCGRPDRADPGRGRHHRAAQGLARAGCGACATRAWRPADRRRGAVGARPHRRLVRLPARERPSRRAGAGQGAGRRRAAGLGVRRHARAHGRLHAGLARLDLRRQPAGGRGRARGAWRCSRKKVSSSAAGFWASTCSRACAPSAARRSRTSAAAASGSAPRSIRAFASAREVCERLLAEGRAVEGDARHGGPPGPAARDRAPGSRLGPRPLRGSDRASLKPVRGRPEAA